jgi:ABC-type dipeptide/oligopeptide/nickel transport system permease component
MRTYAVQRLLLFIPAVLGVTLVVFVLMRLVPGDIATILVYEVGTERAGAAQQSVQKIRHELGLDRPLLLQYIDWLLGAVRGDFGYSYWERRPVYEILRERFPRTMQLALMTMVFALCWSIPLGVMSAVRQDTPIDYLARLVSISGLSIPAFFVGVLMLFFLVRFFRWMPPLEFTAFFDNPSENLKQFIWPALAEVYYISAPITRLTRSLSVGITVGALWGIVTGYFGGIADSLSQRVVDTLIGFPLLILALSLMAVLQQSVHNVIITLAILLIPAAARTLRSTTLSLKEMGYIESARAMGHHTGV